MQFSLLINQERALAWGLNAQQAMLFAFLYEVPSWAKTAERDGQVFYHISKGKVVDELPLLTDKPDTVYRLMKQLQEKGVITLTSSGPYTLMAITDQGKTWNQDGAIPRKNIRGKRGADTSKKARRNLRGKKTAEESGVHRKNIQPTDTPTSDKSPTHHGEKSEVTPDKSPTDQITRSNHQSVNTDTPPSATKRPKTMVTASDLVKDHGVEPDHAAQFLAVRKAKNLPLTVLAMEALVREWGKAGLSVPGGVRVCASKGWAAFRASWNWQEDRHEGQNRINRGQPNDERDEVRDALNNVDDRSWARGL